MVTKQVPNPLTLTLSDSHGRDFTTPGLALKSARTKQKSGPKWSIIAQSRMRRVKRHQMIRMDLASLPRLWHCSHAARELSEVRSRLASWSLNRGQHTLKSWATQLCSHESKNSEMSFELWVAFSLYSMEPNRIIAVQLILGVTPGQTTARVKPLRFVSGFHN